MNEAELKYKKTIEEIKEYAQASFNYYQFKDKQIATDWKNILNVIERVN